MKEGEREENALRMALHSVHPFSVCGRGKQNDYAKKSMFVVFRVTRVRCAFTSIANGCEIAPRN